MMSDTGPEIHIAADDARAGETPHIVRWVLGISLALAVIAMTAAWLLPSLAGDTTIDDLPTRTSAG